MVGGVDLQYSKFHQFPQEWTNIGPLDLRSQSSYEFFSGESSRLKEYLQ